MAPTLDERLGKFSAITSPIGIAVAESGNVYVTGFDSQRVIR